MLICFPISVLQKLFTESNPVIIYVDYTEFETIFISMTCRNKLLAIVVLNSPKCMPEKTL